MKTVLFVPGFQEDINSRDYTSTIRAIKSRGYNVKFVQIHWSRTTIDNWVAQLDGIYKQYDRHDVVLAGFSFGAMTAFVSATKRNPSQLWLFSLSSYFAEDLESKNQKKSWVSRKGHRRVDAFRKLIFKDLVKKITCQTLIFYGQTELDKWPIMDERATDTQKFIKNNVCIIIPNTGHDVTDKEYIEAIKRTI